MNTMVEHINSAGHIFVEFALPMLIQSGVLIVILLLADFLLRKKVKAVFRYWIWMLVLVKLVLPTSLSSPLSLGYFFGDKLTYQDLAETTSALESTEPAPAVISPGINPIYIKPNAFIQPKVPVISGVEPVVAGPVGSPAVSVTPLSWQGVIFLVWLAVVIAMGLLLLQRALFVRGLVAQAREANPLVNDTLSYCCERMGVKGKVGLKVSTNATSPAVCGLIRPMILLPRNLAPGLGASHLRAVLLHELAHIKRGDLWVNLAQTVLQIIYFYNPLLWLANCVIRRVREQAVDEAVLVAMGAKARQYPQTLVDVARLAFKRPALSLRLIGVVESESALAGRIKHILGRPIPKSTKLGILSALAIIIIGAILLPMAKAAHLTGHTRQIMKLAKQEARQLNHEYIGTEHILLALVKEGRGVSGIVLRRLDVDIEKVRFEVRKLVRSGPEVVATKKLPKTPRAKRAMKYGIEESKTLGHDYVGAEHVLLGLLREKDGVAAQVLKNLGLELEDVRQEVLNVVGPKPRKGGYPTLVISGVVTDAATENPIAGARVGDDGYGPKPYRGAVTDSDGRYYYLTWPEHHGIKAQAAGYKGQRKSLYDGHFTFGKEMVEEVFDFALEDVAEASKFKATLSNGVTVELVGVCEFLKDGRNCWKPDGSKLDKAIYVSKGGVNKTTENLFGFIVRTDKPCDIEWLEIEGMVDRSNYVAVVDENGQPVRDGMNYYGIKVWLANRGKTNIRMRVAPSKWNLKATYDGKYIIGKLDPKVRFFESYETANGVSIIFDHDYGNYDCRMVAKVSRESKGPWQYYNGKRLCFSTLKTVYSPGGSKKTAAVFEGLKLSDVEHFEFGIRHPYNSVQFKNVSLQPGAKTDVQVERKKVKAVIDDFWAAIDSGDFDKVRQVSQVEPLVNQDILQKTLIDCNKERKSLLSRGIDTTNVYEVRIEENEAVAVAPANKDRFQWYYLQKNSTGWVIKLFDDAPPSLSMEDILFKCRSIPKLTVLGAALRLHAAEHNSQCPDTLKALEPYIPHGEIYQWLNDNIEYLGAGKKMQTGGSPDSIIAYTKTLLSKDENLSVLYNDASVSFELTKKFKQLKTDVRVEVEEAGKASIGAIDVAEKEETETKNITHHNGPFDMNKQIPVNLESPVVKDVWGRDQKPFKVESVEFVKKDGRLHCSVKIDSTTAADGKFIVRVKIFGREPRDSAREVILGLRGFLFQTHCVYRGFTVGIREVQNLDFGSSHKFAGATSFVVEIEDITYKAESAEESSKTDVQIKTENNIQAPPLKDFERKLIEKVLDLVKQVEKKYPNQATHWPAGPGLYHVDAQGHVTIWHYRALWQRSTDCAPDEVGWGSSQLVNAKGMYYLPDGTPLQSRWRERGGGMKDIRVKVGRTIDENERVAVIHRHSLPSDYDLLSRDGLERNILLDSWKGLPLAIIICVDRPMRLGGWWLGDVETDSQHFNEYDQLIVNGPPGNNNKPMLVTVGLPETDVQVEVEGVASAGAFEELSVKFGGIWMHWQDVEFTVRSDGSVEFSMNTAPNNKTRYRTAFKLSDEHLAELSGLLQKTNWLTAPGANVQPRYSDATRIDISLTREDKVQNVWCHDRNAEPYLSLIIFLKRIQRQEYLLYQMTVPGAANRSSAFSDVYQQIRAERGEPVSAHPHRILDFSRFIRPSVEFIGHPDENHYETVAIAARILGKLKAEQVRPQITDLTTAERKEHHDIAAVIRTGYIRTAAVEALTELGGEQARRHVRDMAKNHRSWRRQVNEALVEGLLELDRGNCVELLKDMASITKKASWGLIRLGPAGIPAIVEILEVRDTKYMGQIYLIRQYIDHWQEVTKPIDRRVIEAVQRNLDYRLGYTTTWTNYHKELLSLAGAPELPSKDARQIAEEFLAAVKANDQMAMGGVTNAGGGSWPQRLAKLKSLPGLQQFEITEVYADTNDNIAWAIAAATGPDNEKSTRARIILNFLSGSVWRVFNIAIERPEIAERMRKRYIESHPNAKPVPAKSSSDPNFKTDVRVESEMTGAEAGTEDRIRAVIDQFWAAVEADDFGRVRQLSQIDLLEKRGALEETLRRFNKERKQLLSRGIDISTIMNVYIRGDEAVAVGKVNKGRIMWYYLEKGPDRWLIKLFDDAPRERTIEEIFTESRGRTAKTDVEVEGTGQKEPKITFENLVCDFGEVGPKSSNSCEFRFTNNGSALLIITRVGAACACTTSIPQKKKEYAPGESGTLKVTYQSGARAGRVTKSVFVYSNASVNPVKLTIKAEIVVKVAHEPERLNLVLDKENAGCPAITLTSLDNQPFAITEFKSTGGNSITADFDSSVKETSFVLKPKVDMEKLRKDPRGNIEISVTHPECKKVTIIYNMLPEFKVDPRVIYVRDAEPQKPVTKKVSVLSNYNEDFEIESTSSKKETVKVLSKQKVRNGYQLELQITPPAPESKRRVFTDKFSVKIKGGEELQVTCYGIYPRKAAGPSEESARRTDVQVEGADKTLVLKPGTKTDMQGEVEKAGKNLYTSKTWQAAFYEAERIIRTRQTWPETPEALAKAFWKTRALKDYKEMEILWPGSGSWNWAEICKNDPAVNYVFGKARKDNPNVPYASEEYFAENQSYNLTMCISSLSTKKGKRYYITSGN